MTHSRNLVKGTLAGIQSRRAGRPPARSESCVVVGKSTLRSVECGATTAHPDSSSLERNIRLSQLRSRPRNAESERLARPGLGVVGSSRPRGIAPYTAKAVER
jgi:hypothetical protein